MCFASPSWPGWLAGLWSTETLCRSSSTPWAASDWPSWRLWTSPSSTGFCAVTSSARRTRRCLKRNNSHLLHSGDLRQGADEKRFAVISALQLQADVKRTILSSARWLLVPRNWCEENSGYLLHGDFLCQETDVKRTAVIFCTVTSCAKKLMWREQRLSSAQWLLVPSNWCEENSGYLLHGDFLCQEANVKKWCLCTMSSYAKKMM